MVRLTRRAALLAAGVLPFLPRRAQAQTPIGSVAEVTGEATLVHDDAPAPMSAGMALAEGDTALTGENALALLILETDTRVNMGAATTVVLSRYLADVGGEIQVGGAIVFDRPEGLAPVDLTFDTGFGQIGVRGTRFFVGPSRGEYAVFCDRGRVVVTNAGVTRELGPGDGVNLTADGPPSEVAQWGAPRVQEAFESVGLTP
ncbi:FecR family protein [Rhodobacter sp. Har01]|uniref:FecR family protein n=1 Tax=Rhodobacter sp. Har01 TaxID=2883999 RepID=UPI001D0635EC|nr:FecR domain-containing protein [Rhodobacter sp. Har01]MCB6177794.1 FecR family protein [Rhodobacter sp. Har01]